ncbi:MAG: gamma-glutamyltransferase [Candidatus Binataceae bacterium]
MASFSKIAATVSNSVMLEKRRTSELAFEFALRRWLVLAGLLAAVMLVMATRAAPAAAVEAHHAMVVSESDAASEAGVGILKQGGNAVDAAAAVALTLGVTNAGSCGIGGGGFMLVYWAKTGKLYALDYRERAPMAATPAMYMRDGKPDEKLARTGPLAIGVPGQIAGIDASLSRFGTMKFQQVAAPAIKLTRGGFKLSPHLAGEIQYASDKIARQPGFEGTFFTPSGAPLKAGDIVREPNLAALMERLGNAPDKNFYHGPIAHEIAGFIKTQGGILTARDLADYRTIWRDPIHLDYQGYDIYTMPPPSSGGVALEVFGMLSAGHLAGLGADSSPYLARLIEVLRQGFIDRAQYADPAFVNVPIAKLLSPRHIAEARERAFHHLAKPLPAAAHDHGTSNFCVADKDGNVVVVTTTINTIFGSKLMVPSLGLILNNEMDDFGVAPGVPNAFKLAGAKANEVAPGKRPLSSMSPIIALKHGHPAFAAGGSGGPTIITGVVQVTLNILDFHMDPEQAVAEPRIHEQASPDIVFVESAMPQKTIAALSQMGYHLKVVPHLGAVNAILIAPDDLQGAYDQRKGGAAAGY